MLIQKHMYFDPLGEDAGMATIARASFALNLGFYIFCILYAEGSWC